MLSMRSVCPVRFEVLPFISLIRMTREYTNITGSATRHVLSPQPNRLEFSGYTTRVTVPATFVC